MTPPVVVLGVTGSIGRQTLEVAQSLSATVVGIAARTPSSQLIDLALGHPKSRVVAVGGTSDERQRMTARLGPRAEYGREALLDLAATPGATVVNGVVGATGLEATMRALEAGNRLALANKESLVAGGPLVRSVQQSSGATLIPVDSEHSALFQLLSGVERAEVRRLVLTASGGPFRGWDREELAEARPDDALRHPTWTMGPRITVDSATLVNKGLEVIEAHVLFDVPFDLIEVVVHPQSVVHSLLELTDGALLAHLGITDMRVPIQYALTHPKRLPAPVPAFDLTAVSLTFEPPDLVNFPALSLAYRAGAEGGSSPAVYNAADEVAVEAFLGGRLGFLGIPEIIERTMESIPVSMPSTVEEVVAVDSEARAVAVSLIAGAC